MEFIEVKPSDIDLIDKIYNNEIESFGIMGGADMWMIMSFIRYGKLYLLMNGDELLTVAQYQKIMGEESVFLYGFSTTPENRNKGYGKELLQKVHIELKKLGIKKICLTVDPNNEIAIKMYKHLGYLIKEFQENEYGKGIHRFLMAKVLS